MANFNNNKTKVPATMYMGLCLPSVCTAEYIKEYMNEFLHNKTDIVQAITHI